MATESKVEFSGTKKREKDGQTAPTETAEKHDGPRATGKRVSQDAKISKCVNSSTDSTLEESKPTGQKKREIGPAEAVRRAANHGRDGRVNLGTGKPSGIEVV
jgi:hypothetical protein